MSSHQAAGGPASLFTTNAPGWSILVRLLVGLAVFFPEGIQKLIFPDILGAGRFANIGIPYPDVMGPFVGTVEIICGDAGETDQRADEGTAQGIGEVHPSLASACAQWRRNSAVSRPPIFNGNGYAGRLEQACHLESPPVILGCVSFALAEVRAQAFRQHIMCNAKGADVIRAAGRKDGASGQSRPGQSVD